MYQLVGVGVGVAALSVYVYYKFRRPPGFPPGPPAWPLVGSLPYFNTGDDPHDEGYRFQMEMSRLATKYGPVFSIALGHSWVVIISDYKVIKEAFVKLGSDVAGRPYLGSIVKGWNPRAPDLGILDGTYDDQWRLQRHTVIQVLKHHGYGGHVTAQCIQNEADILIETFRSHDGEDVHVTDHVSNAVANVTVSLLCGERYQFDHDEFQRVRHHLDSGFEATQKVLTTSKIPALSLLPAYRRAHKQLVDSFKVVNDFIMKKIAENEYEESMGEPVNFLQGYQLELSNNPALQDKLFQVVNDLIQAGLETTTTTLGWAVYFMMMYPDIQRGVQDELDREVGRSRKPRLTDRPSLPYTMATIQEVLRLATTAPSTLPHLTLKTCTIGGYTVPKGTEVWGNLWDVLRDADIWPDPLTLKPERFLNEEGQLIQREEFIAFGLGRRSCLGEQLARQELFIFFTNLLHSFTFTPPGGQTLKPTAKGVIALTHKPPDYRARATPRE